MMTSVATGKSLLQSGKYIPAIFDLNRLHEASEDVRSDVVKTWQHMKDGEQVLDT